MMIKINRRYLETGKAAINSPKEKGIRVMARKELNMKAPSIRIINIAVVFDESIRHCQNFPPLSCLFTRAITTAPKAPIPAASVAVNTPP